MDFKMKFICCINNKFISPTKFWSVLVYWLQEIWTDILFILRVYFYSYFGGWGEELWTKRQRPKYNSFAKFIKHDSYPCGPTGPTANLNGLSKELNTLRKTVNWSKSLDLPILRWKPKSIEYTTHPSLGPSSGTWPPGMSGCWRTPGQSPSGTCGSCPLTPTDISLNH